MSTSRTEPLTTCSAAPEPTPLAALRAYLAERFPVPVTLMLSAATALGAYAAAQSATIGAGAPLIIDGGALSGVLLILLFLLHLRVFDEHKDFQLDAETRPDRPVQRGLVTLGQLRVLGAFAIAGEVALAMTAGVGPALVFAAALIYSVLMFFEFFARDWLGARLIAYALTHTVVMSLLALAVAVRFTMQLELGISPALWGFLALNLISYWAVDVLRKTWAPSSEVDGLDSYSKRYGVDRAGLLGGALLVASATIGGWVGWQLGGRFIWLAIVAAVTLWGLYEIRTFARAASKRGEKRLELVAGIHLLVLFFGVVACAASHGLAAGIGHHGFTLGV